MSLKPCDYYLFGKQHRVSFRIPSTRKPNVLDLVYSDVCGPIDVETLDGNKYFATFISMMKNGGLAKDHWCLLEGRFVVHFTRHK